MVMLHLRIPAPVREASSKGKSGRQVWKESFMRGVLLWLVGVPIPLIILIYLLF